MDSVLTFEDEGKRVVTTEGDVIGSVVRIEDGAAHVRPKAGLLDGCGSWITGSWDSTDAFELDGRVIEDITNETIVVAPEPITTSESERIVEG